MYTTTQSLFFSLSRRYPLLHNPTMVSPFPSSLPHVFMVSFPGQGHVNPLLRLGKYLASKGLLITLCTPEIFGKQIRKANPIIAGENPIKIGEGFIRFEFIQDGLEEGDPIFKDPDLYFPDLEMKGKAALHRMIEENKEMGRPVSCLINNSFIPWVSDVAEAMAIPNAVLWVQSCACFAAYYHYGKGSVPFPSERELELDVQLPAMPLLKHDEIPSFLHPTTPYTVFRRAIMGQYRNLSYPFCILMDTFMELEEELIENMSEICPVKPVGPLFRNAGGYGSEIRGDMMRADEECLKWLDLMPECSVVYVSFGSIVSLKQTQLDEFAAGILNSGVSFLWVVKPVPEKPVKLPEVFLEKAGDRGKIVEWSPQEQVLAHPAVACFVTHCGWNSSIEAVTNGVPVVAFPHWGDQVTNAKYLVEVFGVGLRLSRGEAENRTVTAEEVERCLREATSGGKAAELKEKALKWKKKAEEAVAEGGSSDRNMKDFVEEIKRRSI